MERDKNKNGMQHVIDEEKPRMLILIRSSATPLTSDQIPKACRVVKESFRNGRFDVTPMEMKQATNQFIGYRFWVDLLSDDQFPFDGCDFVERLGLDPSEWKIVMEIA